MCDFSKVPINTLLKLKVNIENKQKELEESKRIVIEELERRKSYYIEDKQKVKRK